jgi:hypothetical protein
MGLDELRARLDRLLAGAGPRSRAAGLKDALVELKVAAGQSRDALAAAERELSAQQRQLTDAERRGRLAAEIGDHETAAIAGDFAVKHRERIGLLERKVAVIRDELAFVEREYQEVAAEYRSGGASSAPSAPAEPASDREDLLELNAMKARADRDALERVVKEQLELLKKKIWKS